MGHFKGYPGTQGHLVQLVSMLHSLNDSFSDIIKHDKLKIMSQGETSYDFYYMWNLKRNDTNELTYKTKRDSQTSKMNLYGCQGEGIVRKSGKLVYTLLYSIQIINRDLLYSTRNSTQCVCQPGWEKASGKVDTCLWVDECFPCSPETTTALLIGCTPIPNKKFQVKFARNINQKRLCLESEL